MLRCVMAAFAYLACRKFSKWVKHHPSSRQQTHFTLNAPYRPKKSNLQQFSFLDSANVQYLENFQFKMAKCSHQNFKSLNLDMDYELDYLS